MHVKWTMRWVWTQWHVGAAWTREADMPGFDGLVWWENHITMICLSIGPVLIQCFITGPRRNVRIEPTREMIERN